MSTTIKGPAAANANATSSKLELVPSDSAKLKTQALAHASSTTIKAGDTLSKLVDAHYPGAKGVTKLGMAAALAYVNGLQDPNKIEAGKTLKLPKNDDLVGVAITLYVMAEVLEDASDHKQALSSVLQANRYGFADGTRIDVLGKSARVFSADGKRDENVTAKFDGHTLTLTGKQTAKYDVVLGQQGYALKDASGKLGENAFAVADTVQGALNRYPYFGIKHGAVDDSELRFYGDKVSYSSTVADEDANFSIKTQGGKLTSSDAKGNFTVQLDDGQKLTGKFSDLGIELSNGYTYQKTPDWFSA
jgi:hypothetical protein